MSEELMVRCCAPTLASLKTGNMFSTPCESREKLQEYVCGLNRRLRSKGLCVLPLRYRDGMALVYVYRPKKLSADLSHDTARRLLSDRGYPCGSSARCVQCLQSRLAMGEDFPHEIGLFLGYPPEDVDGFIHRKGEAKCTGCWKVYGDVAQAQKTFARFKKCTDTYVRHWANGSGIEKLTVSA